MIENKFQQGRKPVYVERYTSNSDLLETNKGRNLPIPDHYSQSIDYFSDRRIDMKRDEWNGGYRDNRELIDSWLDSKVDTELSRDIGKFAMECTATNTDKLTRRKYRVAGGAVAMGRFMAGEPQCMVAVVRQQVKSKVLDLAVDICVSAYINARTVKAVGQVLAGAVAQLESSGYNMRVHVLCGVSLNNSIILNDVLLKDVKERFNADKMLYALSNPGYARGIMFGWCVRNPHFDGTYGLGLPLYWEYHDKRNVLDRLYQKATGLDKVLVLQGLADRYERMSGTPDERIRKMRDEIVKQLTS